MRVPKSRTESSRTLESCCLVPAGWFTLSLVKENLCNPQNKNVANNSIRNYSWHFCRRCRRKHLPNFYHQSLIITTAHFPNFQQKHFKGIEKQKTTSSRAFLSWRSKQRFILHPQVSEIRSVPCALTICHAGEYHFCDRTGIKSFSATEAMPFAN